MVKINGMSVEAYEQYGDHPSPSVYATCDWSEREARLDYERAVLSLGRPFTDGVLFVNPEWGNQVTK